MSLKLQNYEPPQAWTGREDPDRERLHDQITPVDLQAPIEKSEGIGFLGFCSDEGVRRNQGRVGAVEGPKALRESLQNIPVNGGPYYDFGDIHCQGEDLEAAQIQLGASVATMLTRGIRPILLGGGHEVSWGHFQGICSALPGKHIAIVNIDAHYDLRPLLDDQKGSSGTSFLQISQWCQSMGVPFHYSCIGVQKLGNTNSLFRQADELGVRTVYADQIHREGVQVAMQEIEHVIAEHDHIYLTICLDAFAAPYAPGVSAPQVLGLNPWHVIPLLQRLTESNKVISLDVAEMSPKYDIDGRTAQLGAALISQFL